MSNSTVGILWEEPPGGNKYAKALQAITTRPGEWARLELFSTPSAASSLAQGIRNKRRATPPGKWEAVSRRFDEDTWGVWVRYMGNGDEA